MDNWYQTKQVDKLIFLAIALICASCNSYKKASSYPMINSVVHKKSVFLSFNNYKSAHKKSLTKIDSSFDLSSSSYIKSKKTRNDSNITQLHIIPIISNLRSTNNINCFPMPSNNQGRLTASLSTEPIITRYIFIPDTSKTNGSSTIDSTQIKITQIHPSSEYDHFESSAKKQKQRETFATISLIAAFASIASLFTVAILFFPSVIAAIVFGALGLKSSRRKRALSGMLIGITMIILLTLLVIAYVGAFS